MLFKNRDFVVIVFENDKKDKFYVKADSKKEAIKSVLDVLTKCSIFNYSSTEDIKIKCRKMTRNEKKGLC